MEVVMRGGSPRYKKVDTITDIDYGTMILHWNDGSELELNICDVKVIKETRS